MSRGAPLWVPFAKGPGYWSLKGPNTGVVQVLDKAGSGILATFAFRSCGDLGERLKTALKPFAQASGGMLPVKIVCDHALTRGLREVLPQLGFHILRLVERSGEYEIRCYPESGRLQVTMPKAEAGGERPNERIKVLIIDDSPLIASILSNIFRSDSSFEVVGTVGLPSQVDAAIRSYRPDVITLDLHLPEMNGVDLLNQYLPKYQIPTVIVSSVSPDEGPLVVNALECGAVDYIQKPSAAEIGSTTPIILEKVKAAAQITPRSTHLVGITKAMSGPMPVDETRIIAIGSSTGGTKALREIFLRLPKRIPPIVVVQHIPAGFSAAFAERLNQICEFPVKEAADGDPLVPGRVLIAPGGRHMKIEKDGSGFVVKIEDSPHVNSHRPSVDVLFGSIVENCGAGSLGVLLTGMGSDGAKGLLAMRKKGCFTLAQDEASCVVYGMPQAAVQMDAASKVVSLLDIAQALVDELSSAEKKKIAA
jgi:two-component system chemotaxis response regulator CheB